MFKNDKIWRDLQEAKPFMMLEYGLDQNRILLFCEGKIQELDI
jgi:hypothetical protein